MAYAYAAGKGLPALPHLCAFVPLCLCVKNRTAGKGLPALPSAPKGLSKTLSFKKCGRVVAEPLSVALAKLLLPLGVYNTVHTAGKGLRPLPIALLLHAIESFALTRILFLSA